MEGVRRPQEDLLQDSTLVFVCIRFERKGATNVSTEKEALAGSSLAERPERLQRTGRLPPESLIHIRHTSFCSFSPSLSLRLSTPLSLLVCPSSQQQCILLTVVFQIYIQTAEVKLWYTLRHGNICMHCLIHPHLQLIPPLRTPTSNNLVY